MKTIQGADHFYIIGHKNPDGDCIFSSLALAEMLRVLGKRYTLLNDGPYRNSDITPYATLFSSEFKEVPGSVTIVVDCSTAERVGLLFPLLSKYEMIVLDHHSSGEPFTKPELSYIIPSSPSTTLVLEKLREALNTPLTKTMAEYLFKGFATDSGYFHFLSEEVGGEALRMVSRFVDAGVSPYVVYDELHDGKTMEFIHQAGKLRDRAEAYSNGKLIVTYERLEERSGLRTADSVYNELLQVAGVKLILFFKENETNVEIGLRSKNLSGIDVGEFAGLLGGGGHFYAAGVTREGTLEQVMKDVIERAQKLFD